MKKVLFVLLITTCVLRLPGQTNEPIRLALVSESTEMSAAADVLTAELSSRKDLQLLERNEIETVYREQGLSAGNKDYLKLGQILGADGLLLLESVEEGTNQLPNIPFAAKKPLIVNVRLVAAKPGVVLVSERFSLFMKDLPDWSASFSKHLNLFFPKLAVLAKDAVPISVVNLRSAISSADAQEMERQLKSLTIQRLSREPQLFVLERQRMQMLSEEKELKSDESAFWNGSYLLEGVVDQNGYSKDVITINARLAPPKGGQPLLFEVSGSRTNLAEVVNRLAVKLAELLKVNSASKEWSAADEATQYFQEAQWALRWGIFVEAQTAAESAWALGKKDLECAQLRVMAYMNDLPEVLQPNLTKYGHTPGYRFVHISQPPDVKDCEMATRALECYYEFCRISPDGEPRVLSRGKNDWHKSDWYQLGTDVLTSSSGVLRHFYYFSESQAPIAGKLADLRALARSVAALISKSPSVHDSYFVGDRIVSAEEFNPEPITAWADAFGQIGKVRLYRGQTPGIFDCAIKWGCFWQERPEETVEFYRGLMASPLFFRIQDGLWFRGLDFPRLVAWNEADKKRIPAVWGGFVNDLNTSTNYFFRFEGQAITCADARTRAWAGKNPDIVGSAEIVDADPGWKDSRAALLDFISTNYEAIIGNNDNLAVNDWGMNSLLGEKPEYASRFAAIQQTYRTKASEHLKESASRADFEKQKHYLASFKPYNWDDFNKAFDFRNYTKAQAAELQPLIAAYKSNLLAQVPANASPFEKFKVGDSVHWIGFYLESHVNAVLNPPAPAPRPPAPPSQQTPQVISQPALAVKSKATNSISNQTSEVVTNVLLVKKFLPIPLDGLPGDKISAATITAHHWLEGKLVLDFQYGAFAYSFDGNGNWQSTRNVTFPAIAILDPATEHWQVISCPELDITSQNRFYHHTTLCRGEVFTSEGGRIQKYDAAKNAWQVLDVSGVGNCELFTVNDHLYAATSDLILEILDGGARTHILASNRRQPPVSALDTESLGTPALFAGPGGSLRATAGNKMVAWDGNDWRAIGPAPQSSLPPVISDDGILFLADGWNAPAGIWHLTMGGDQIECWVRQKPERGRSATGSGPDKSPAWQLPPDISPLRLPAASRGPDLYLLVDHAKSQNIVNEEEHRIIGKKILPQNGYHAGLLCFAAHDPVPQKIFLKFDGDDARLPVTGDNRFAGFMLPNLPSSWLLFSTNYLFCGRETFGSISSGVGSSSAMRTQTGIWMIPLEQIDSELARLRKIQQERQTLADAAARQAAQMLLEKYDRNHNGVIDVDEREAAFDDPVFIESELDKIDANHNGRLGAVELAYFDANTNKILEPKEQAGIEITQNLLAERFFKRFDTGEDGLLDRSEFNELYKSITENSPQSMSDFFGTPFAMVDQNHDSQIDLLELEKFLVQGTQDGLRSWAIPNSAGLNPMRTRAGQPVDQRQVFKAAVEFYWQNPAGITNRPPFQNGMPPGAGWDPGRMQQFPKP